MQDVETGVEDQRKAGLQKDLCEGEEDRKDPVVYWDDEDAQNEGNAQAQDADADRNKRPMT